VAAATPKERAAAEGKSPSAYVAAELTKIAARPTNAQIVARLKARDRAGGLYRVGRSLEAPLCTCEAKLDSGSHDAQVVTVHRVRRAAPRSTDARTSRLNHSADQA